MFIGFFLKMSLYFLYFKKFKVFVTMFLYILTILCACFSLTHSRVITFGISVNEFGSQGALHQELLKGLKYSAERINQFSESNRVLSMTNESFTFEIFPMYDFGNQTIFRQNYIQMAKNSSIDFLLSPAPSGTGWALEAMTIAKSNGRSLFFGPADSRDNWYSAGGLGAAISTRSLMRTIIPYLVLAKVKNVSVLAVEEAFQRESCDGFIKQIGYNRINVSIDIRISHQASIVPEMLPNLSQVVDKLIASNGQVMVICAHKAILEWTIGEFRKRNVSPGAFVTTTFFQPFDDPDLQKYVLSFANLPPRDAAYPDIPNWGNLATFYDTYKSKYNEEPGTMSINALITLDTFYRAILSAGIANESFVHAAMKQTNYDSIVGPVIFGANGQNMLEAALLQQTSNHTIIIGPALATTGEMIYPFPRWDMREPEYKWGSGADKLGLALIVTVIILLLVEIITLISVWKTGVARAGSRVFLLISAVGSIITELSLIPWMPGLVSDSSCKAVIILLVLGSCLMLVSLIVKGWRIVRLFDTSHLGVFKITDQNLGAILACIITSALILPILMISIGDVDAKINVPHPYELRQNFLTCNTNATFAALLIATLVYGGIIIVTGIVIITKIRNRIPVELSDVYDEATPLFYATWATLLVYVVLIIIQYVLTETRANRDLSYILTSIFISAGILFINIFVFGRTFDHIRRGVKSSSNRSVMLSTGTKSNSTQ